MAVAREVLGGNAKTLAGLDGWGHAKNDEAGRPRSRFTANTSMLCHNPAQHALRRRSARYRKAGAWLLSLRSADRARFGHRTS
jgi:hypothetical protein